MRRKWPIVMVIIVVLLIIGIAYAVSHADISALPEPGSLETSVATRTRNWLIARAAQSLAPASSRSTTEAVSKGKALYDMECASCHGPDGRHPTAIGQAMYPRVPDLGSGLVQGLSNREIFWVVKNGVRLSGMPGFARIDNDNDIWNLVFYLRSLRGQTKPLPSALSPARLDKPRPSSSKPRTLSNAHPSNESRNTRVAILSPAEMRPPTKRNWELP